MVSLTFLLTGDMLLRFAPCAIATAMFGFETASSAKAVGAARRKCGVAPPATTSDKPEFTYAFRAHQNSIEWITPSLIAVWLPGVFGQALPVVGPYMPLLAGSAGIFAALCRLSYAEGYRKDADSRVVPFHRFANTITYLFYTTLLSLAWVTVGRPLYRAFAA